MEAPDTGKIINIAYLAGFLLALFVVYKILSAVGLIKSPKKKKQEAEQKAAVNAVRTSEYFNPKLYKEKVFKQLGANTANFYAQQLHKAVRGAGTDEELIFSTFSKFFNKCNISEVAASYFLQYGRDLRADLLSDLNDKEVVQLTELINQLPNN